MASRQMSYRTYGQSDRPPVLLLHGFLGCKEDWEEVASDLTRDHFVITVDLPGHGGSVDGLSERDYTMAGCSDMLVSVLDSLKIDRCSVIGYSMGGRLALYFAIYHAERCNAVIAESASPGLRTESERSERRAHDESLVNRILAAPLGQFLEGWYAQPLFEPLRSVPGLAELLKRRRRNDPRGLALSLRTMGTGAQPSLWDSLAAIKLPVLLLTGALDVKFTRIAREIALACPTCRTEVIEGCGHTLHFEAPDRYIAAVRKFLRERK